MSIVLDRKKSNLGSPHWLKFQIWFIVTLNYKIRQILLQNVTKVYHKMRQVFFIAKSDSFITKSDSHYKMRRYSYKMRQLLQNTAFTT